MDKKIYHYHPETKEYIGESLAASSPLEPDVFLIPAHATELQPPAVKKGKQLVFENEAWVYQDIPDGAKPDKKPAIPKDPLEEIRFQRNVRLRNTDWTQLPDAPISKELKQAYKEYRVLLRDFPKTCDPVNPQWPQEPVI